MDDQKLEEAHFNGKLLKPISVTDLLSEVSKYLTHTKNEDISIKKTPSELKLSEEQKNILLDKDSSYINDLYLLAIDDAFVDSAIKFGKSLLEINKELEIEILNKIGKSIIYYAENYDIEKMKESLLQYDKFIKKIKK